MKLFGFGKKPKTTDRYDGKPFLRLVDSFVLKCIGELHPDQEAALIRLTPKFQEVYASSETWDEIVISQMHFPSNIREEISKLWEKNLIIAEQNDVVLSPEQFVEMFVSSNIGEIEPS